MEEALGQALVLPRLLNDGVLVGEAEAQVVREAVTDSVTRVETVVVEEAVADGEGSEVGVKA